MRRRLDVLATICMEFDLDPLREFARLKKELKEMGTGFMSGKEKQWKEAILYHRACSQNNWTCDCKLARDFLEDVEELRKRLELNDGSPPPASPAPSLRECTLSNSKVPDASDKDQPTSSSTGISLSTSTSSLKQVN